MNIPTHSNEAPLRSECLDMLEEKGRLLKVSKLTKSVILHNHQKGHGISERIGYEAEKRLRIQWNKLIDTASTHTMMLFDTFLFECTWIVSMSLTSSSSVVGGLGKMVEEGHPCREKYLQ